MRKLRSIQKKLPDSPLVRVLIEYRESNHLSIGVMAKQMGISHPTLLKMLHTGTSESIPMWQLLARFFVWTPGELGVAAMWEPPPKKKRAKRGE